MLYIINEIEAGPCRAQDLPKPFQLWMVASPSRPFSRAACLTLGKLAQSGKMSQLFQFIMVRMNISLSYHQQTLASLVNDPVRALTTAPPCGELIPRTNNDWLTTIGSSQERLVSAVIFLAVQFLETYNQQHFKHKCTQLQPTAVECPSRWGGAEPKKRRSLLWICHVDLSSFLSILLAHLSHSSLLVNNFHGSSCLLKIYSISSASCHILSCLAESSMESRTIMTSSSRGLPSCSDSVQANTRKATTWA